VGYGLGNEEFILFPCLDVRDWVWEMIEQMPEVPFSYMYQFFWYEGSFVILDIILQASHHKSIPHPSTWDMNGEMSPLYPYPRVPLFPKPTIQTLEKIYPNHHIPIPPLISLYPNTILVYRKKKTWVQTMQYLT
jgi:hypothetical protein